MNNQVRPTFLYFVTEFLGCLIMFASFATILVMIFALGFQALEKEAKEGEKVSSEKRSTIEGEVISVEMKKVPDPFDEKPPEDGKKRIQFRFGKFEVDRTLVKFADGREKEFSGVPDKPIPKAYVVIEYDGRNYVKSITLKEPVKEQD